MNNFLKHAGVSAVTGLMLMGCMSEEPERQAVANEHAAAPKRQAVVNEPAKAPKRQAVANKPVSNSSQNTTVAQPDYAGEISRLKDELRREVETLVAADKFDEARDVVLKIRRGSADEVTDALTAYRKELLLTYINPKNYERSKQLLHSGVASRMKDGDFQGARAFVENYPFARNYATPIDLSLAKVRKELSAIGITEEKNKEGFDKAVELLVEYYKSVGQDWKNDNGEVKSDQAGSSAANAYKLDTDELRKVLTAHECSEEKQNEVIACLNKILEDFASKSKTDPVVSENRTIISLGTTTYNELLAKLKEEELKNTIVPAQFKEISSVIKTRAKKLIAANDFSGARDFALSYQLDVPEDLSQELLKFRRSLINETINPAHLQFVLDNAANGVKARVAKNEFAQARKYLQDLTRINMYSSELERCLKNIEQELLALKLDEADVHKLTGQIRTILAEEYFKDTSLTPNIKKAGADYTYVDSPGMKRFEKLLAELRKSLNANGCTKEQTERVVKLLQDGATPLLNKTLVPVEPTELAVPLALGNTALRSKFDKIVKEIVHDRIAIPEIQFHIAVMTKAVDELVNKNEFVKAHQYLCNYPNTGLVEIDERIDSTRKSLAELRVTPAELKYHIGTIGKLVTNLCAKNLFTKAREAMKEYPKTGIKSTDDELEKTKQRLLTEIIRPREIVSRRAELLAITTKMIADKDFLGVRIAIDSYTLTDDDVVAKELSAYKQELLNNKVTPAEIQYHCEQLTGKAGKTMAGNDFSGAREVVMTYIYHSIPEVNNAIADTKKKLLDEINKRQLLYILGEIHKDIRGMLEAGEFATARTYVQDYPLLGLKTMDDEIIKGKANIIHNVINPAHAAARVNVLRKNVFDRLNVKDVDGARKAVKDFGICGVAEVDAIVFAVKCGLLNARINIETLNIVSAKYTKQMADALSKNDFARAKAIVDELKNVPAYSEVIDENLEKAAAAAKNLGSGTGAQDIVDEVRKYLYNVIANRDGNYQGDDLVRSSDRNVSWETVYGYMQIVAQKLLDDDMTQKDVNDLVKYVMDGFMKGGEKSSGRDSERKSLTTAELNREIELLRLRLSGDFSAALTNAKNEEAARISAQVAKESLNSVDLDGSISALQLRVSRAKDNSITQIIGEGVRVLRLIKIDVNSVSSQNATNLLAAAAYCGFEDVMKLAFTLGANSNGCSTKDPLKRTPLLLAIEGGMGGDLLSIFPKVNAGAADAEKNNAVHYAVRFHNVDLLPKLLRDRVNAGGANSQGMTPLMLAARIGDAGMVKALIPYNKINAKSKEGNTAFLWAATSSNAKAVKALVNAKADIKAQNERHLNAVDLAAAGNGSMDVLAYLMNDLKLAPGEQQILFFIRNGNIGAMTRIAKYAKTALTKESYLLMAIRMNSPEMVKLLVEQGGDLHTEAVKKALNDLKEQVAALDIVTQTTLDIQALDLELSNILKEKGISAPDSAEAKKLFCEKMKLDLSEVLKEHGIIDKTSAEARKLIEQKTREIADQMRADALKRFRELASFLKTQGIMFSLKKGVQK